MDFEATTSHELLCVSKNVNTISDLDKPLDFSMQLHAIFDKLMMSKSYLLKIKISQK